MVSTKNTLTIFIVGLIAISGVAQAATMNDYCVIPAFSSTSAKPNVMVVMDFSGSMQFPAYLSCDHFDQWGYGYDGYVAQSGAATSSTANNYNSATTYYGLFDSSKNYQYDSSTSVKKFRVNTSCSYNPVGTNTCISGNLLNWITSTRIDVARKVLTGGRTGTGSSDTYQSEGATLSYADNGLGCTFTIANNTASGSRMPKDRTLAIASGGSCALGNLSASRIDVIPQDVTADTGIIQDFYDKVTFEFMMFNSDNTGKIIYGKAPADPASTGGLPTLVPAIFNQVPYNGTPTGEALWEAYDYYKQHSDHSNYDNSSYISAGDGSKDPYYDGSGGSSVAVPCRKSFVLLLSDGAWNGNVDPVIPARSMRGTDLRSGGAFDLSQFTQSVTTYAVYAFGDRDADVKTQGRNAMVNIALFGGYDDNDSNGWPYPFTGYNASASGDCGSTYGSTKRSSITDMDGNTYCNSRATPASPNTYPLSRCNPPSSWNSSCREWDKNKTGLPYNFFEADDGDTLATSLYSALNDMVRRASSGTAASVLASSQGSGANLLQAVFYPKRLFNTDEISWTGEIQNLWYYIDPFLQNTSIREDTDNNKTLNLTSDDVIQFFFDSTSNKTRANRYQDTNADGAADTAVDTVDLEDIKSLWEAGTSLLQRTSARKVYTTTNGTSVLTGDFSTSNSTTLRPYLQATDDTEAQKIINYVLGTDQTGYRSRTVTASGTTGVWKLGDIVDSTPRIQASIPLNGYHLAPPDGYADTTYQEYIQGSSYLSRGMAYAGGNDGMLHAFILGTLEEAWTGQGTNDKARLTGTNTGTEAWAFIPKNALPYLKYLADPNYCHLYYVNLPPAIVDTSASSDANAAKTASSWKTVLIGGMGLGGASRITSDSCTTGAAGTCVKTPITDPADSSKGLGYSSYFALNITDPNTPSLLWEFSSPDLGYSTSGPAIIRIGDPNKNGKWFAVFASGPTGPIDASNNQFLGQSNQNLRIFVLDLLTGSLTRTIDTGISNAFGGSLYNTAVDTERGDIAASGRYSDNVFYLGYTKKDTATSTWTKGGVLRITTKEDPNPNNWFVSTVIDNIGPVTTTVTKLQNRKGGKLWLYFGTGRFFYRYGATVDDPTGSRALYGLIEPCYTSSNTIDTTCTSTISSGLTDQSGDTPSSSLSSGATGWYITLDTGERVITDPLAVFSGVVFFTTFAPATDICSLGGSTYVWAVKYDAGNQYSLLQGKAITQVSTGAIQELSLGSVFTQKAGRRTAGITGMPPRGQGLSVLLGPRPLKKILQTRER